MRLAERLADLRGGLLDLLFAPVCLGCGRPVSTRLHERRVCPLCRARFRPLPAPRCPRCDTPRVPQPVTGVDSCRVCPALPASLRCVRSAVLYEPPVRDLVRALKFGGWQGLAGDLAPAMADLALPSDVVDEVRLLVPVPLSAVRLRQRGYNQAELLGLEVAARLGLESAPELLQRPRATVRQSSLHPDQRRANVAGAFAVPEAQRGRIRGEHLLLVDDVWTTGATGTACVDALVRAGARAVSMLTLARSVPALSR